MKRSPLNADLSGNVCLVTGGSAGIGKEIARALAAQKATVVIAARTPKKAEAAREQIVRETGNPDVSVLTVDFSLQGSIREFAPELTRLHPKLDVLVNNAGGWTTERETTAEGIERTWATNMLGYHLVTKLLIRNLRSAGKARIVNVSSEAAGDLDLEDVEFAVRKYRGFAAFRQTRQADRMFSWALAEKLAGTGVTVNAMTPGHVRSEFNRDAGGILRMIMPVTDALFGRLPREGADTAAWLASSPDVEGVTGKFWQDRKERKCEFRDDRAAMRKLIELCDRMTALRPLPEPPPPEAAPGE
jgi:NAD(P)-dependent dehydrogenase (short-subunit alcohol dehydrogenase family)